MLGGEGDLADASGRRLDGQLSPVLTQGTQTVAF
jgi:hypothetical protein